MIITQKRRSCLFNGCTARKKIRQATQRLEYPIFIGFTLHVLRLWLSHDMVMPSARFDETGELILNEPSNKPTLTNLASSFNSTLLSRPPILAEVDYTVNQNAVGGSINVTPQAPAPIFVVSLPKSGTTSIHHFFECGGFASVHFRKHPGPFLGSCIKKNIHWKRKPFEDCGPFNVWSDPNYIKMNQCYHPAVKHLEKIMKAYAPNITLVLSVRNPKKWLKSLQLWDGKRKDVAPMWIRLQTCEQGSKFPNQYDLGRNVTDQDFLKFYAGYTRHVRRQAARFNVTLIEVDLEESTVGDVLSRATGIDSTCWGHYNVGRYHSVPNNVTQAASIGM